MHTWCKFQAGSTTSGDDPVTATASEVELQRMVVNASGRNSAVPSLIAQGGTTSRHSSGTPQHHHRCRKANASSRSRSSSGSRRSSAAPPPMLPSALKKPKDDKIIIEELQVANCHLRKMVDSLFYELSNCQQENFDSKIIFV